MIANWQLVTLSLAYIGLLFVIAHLGDKYRHKGSKRFQPIIYALSLGVYCTSWSFLGTTGQASTSFLSHLPIYLGPIILFVFAWPLLQRIIRVSLKLNLTSIADLLAARYGKSHNLAVMVTLVALIGTLPYLALQLKAIVYSFEQLQIENTINTGQFGLLVSFVLAGFTIVFGIRHLDVTERHPGVMMAIAFESLVKIAAFIAVAIFVMFFLFDSPHALWQESSANIKLDQQLQFPNMAAMSAMLIIVMAAFLSLPRQFQVMVVELEDEKHTGLSRRVFPIYLLIFAVLAVPLGLAGELLLSGKVPSDTYVLFLPSLQEQHWLTLFAFLGAISAASSMVIISSIALSTMLSNEIIFPIIFKKLRDKNVEFDEFRSRLLKIRKSLVLFVILLGYTVFLLASQDTLSSMGEVAFGAFAQLTPALLAAFYWRRASLTGVYAGILIGFSCWLFLNFLPQLNLYPQPLEGAFLPANSFATLISLSANIAVLWLISQVSRQSVQERMQASIFLEWQMPDVVGKDRKRNINVRELELLVAGFVGEEKAVQSFTQFELQYSQKSSTIADYNQRLLDHTENMLTSVMGASSARLVLSSALEGRDIALDELAVLVGEASSQKHAFSQSLLQHAIENASEGFSIIDKDLKLVAWNKKYLDFFNYPDELIYIGSPVEGLIRFNVERGFCGPGDINQQIAKRIEYLRQGSPHASEREHSDGRVIRIEGNPLPDGGFVMMFSDITAFRQAEQVLKAENVDLEALVAERTDKLEQANRALALAQIKAEQAHQKKSLYLKACSHDLMQPLEAARLFASALSSQNNLTDDQQRQVKNIDHSLKVASDILSDLAEISRIEGGSIKPNPEPFALQELFDSLANDFVAQAKEQHVLLDVQPCSAWVYSDIHILRRVLQNLLSNAIRYASPGVVQLNAQIEDEDRVIINVIDDGPGIPEQMQKEVFEQFTQLASDKGIHSKGLGLGLNIARGLVKLLGHKIALISESGEGCTFSIKLNKVEAVAKTATKPVVQQQGLEGVSVLCIDNDPDVLSGMVELLSAWNCEVYAADNVESAIQEFSEHKSQIDIILADYQLEDRLDGIGLVTELRKLSSTYVPAILITATTEQDIAQKAKAADIEYMKKLVKPAALRALMSAQLAKRLQSTYGDK